MQPISRVAPQLDGPVLLRQRWSDVLFVHWRVDPAAVRPLLPAGVVPDEFDGSAWVGLIPFRMSDTAPLGAVSIPYFGSFTEVNVRLYGVDARGRRGVVFASLEASRLAAALTARAVFGLPYFWASASARRDGDTLAYASRRAGGARPATRIVATITRQEIVDDPLADFLTARWLLFQQRGRRTVAMPNRHDSWKLFDARLDDVDDGLVAASGLTGVAGRAPDSVLYSPGVVTEFGAPERLR